MSKIEKFRNLLRLKSFYSGREKRVLTLTGSTGSISPGGMNMKKGLICLIMIFFLISLLKGNGQMNQDINSKIENEKKILLEKDNEISAASASKGILAAFLPYLTEESLLFPEKGDPIFGKTACTKTLEERNAAGRETILEWEPLFADVSTAVDLGYTHGRFKRPKRDADGKETTDYGYYGTIWQKDSQGNWKVVVSQGLLLINDLGQPPAVNRLDKKNLDAEAKAVVETELAFSAYSVQNNIPEAFYHFIADDGIALSSGGSPRGKDVFARAAAAAKEKKETTAPKAKLIWKPIYAHAAISGDMAYDYGPYEYSSIDASNNKKSFYGYFVTVWKKQADGIWKFVHDGGNDSPGAQEPFRETIADGRPLDPQKHLTK
jgi:ketosteroid isomerase-like protein